MDEIQEEINAYENLMQQRIYDVVATIAAAVSPMIAATTLEADGNSDEAVQAVEKLNEFIGFHQQAKALKEDQ